MNGADFEKIKEEVRLYEGEKRFAHTLAVMREAEYICRKCGFDEAFTNKAVTAALLHDITKKFSPEEQSALLIKYGISSASSEPTMHEKTGAHFARERFGKDIVDDEIFSAVYHHTTGGKNMSALDMTIFIADYTEETRKHDICRKTREYLHNKCEKINRDRANAEILLKDVTLKIIANTLEFLLRERQQIDTETVEAWNSMI